MIMMDILLLDVPSRMARCETAKSPKARAIYNAITNFFALKTHKPNITIITAKIKFNKVVTSNAIIYHSPL